MIIRELINELRKFPADMQVAMASDEEGNSFFNVSYMIEEGETDEGEIVAVLYPAYPEIYF
jgi:hypothetical protein